MSIHFATPHRVLRHAVMLFLILLLLLPATRAHSQAAEDAYHQGVRQQLAADYGLTGGEWLFPTNEQTTIDSVGTYEGAEKSTQTVDGMPFSLAVRLSQSATPNRPWDVGAVFPTTLAVAEGDVVLLVFWIRGVDADVANGYLRTSFQDRTTFDSSVFRAIAPTADWQQIFIPFEVKHANDADAAIYGLQLGAMPQTLEIGGFTGINFGTSVALADLPDSPQGNYPGQEADAAWRAAAERRIAQHRMADLVVNVIDRNGAPLADAEVSVQMQEHAFLFGSAVSIPMILGESPDVDTYLDKLTNLDGNGHGFNSLLLEWGLQWIPWEGFSGAAYSPQRAVEAIGRVRQPGMTIRGHSLVWGGWRWLPPDMEENQDVPAYLIGRVDERLDTILNAEGVRGVVSEWDAVNEPKLDTQLANALAGSPNFPTGAEINPYIFKKAEEIDPSVRLYVNDYFILNEGGLMVGPQQHYHRVIQNLIDSGARLDGIGFQSHMAYPLSAPERVYDVLDDFAVYGRELHISEYDVEITDEAKAGAYTRDFLTIVFSHPSVTAFTLWNFWDPIHWLDNAPLFRSDWSLKPSGEAIFDLLFNEWWTDEMGSTDSAGQYATRAFLGDYEIRASVAGSSAAIETAIVSGSNAITIVLGVDGLLAPQVDGVVDELWSGVPALQLGNTILGDAVSSADLSATAHLLATDTFLYALIEVMDDDLRNDSGEQWWEDDAVEIYLDGDRSAGDAYDGVNDAQLIFRWNDGSVIVGPNSVAAPEGLVYSMVQTGGGYRLEVAIPIAALGIPTGDGSQFAIDVHVIDDDLSAGESTRENKIAWSATVDELWRAPSRMGSVQVVDRGPYREVVGVEEQWFGFLPILRK